MLRFADSRGMAEKDLNAIREIYTEAFPPEERRDWQGILSLIDNENSFMLKAVYEDDEPIGFITGWDFPDFIYLEHFATAPSARNRGYGARIFSEILSSEDKPHVIEVERPDGGMASRRIKFYERLGMSISDTEYVQPPYSKGGKPVPMFIMTDKGYDRKWADEIRDKVYNI